MRVRSSSPENTEGPEKRRRKNLEKNVSTEQYFQKKNPRIQGPDGHEGRAPDPEKKKGQGKEDPHGLRGPLDFSFPPAVRIRSRTDFLKVQRNGKKLRGRCFTLLTLRNDLPSSRFGITVSRKIGNAVERNRVKRRIREIQRLWRREVLPGNDIVVIARRDALTAPFEEMEGEFLRLVRNAGLARRGQQV